MRHCHSDRIRAGYALGVRAEGTHSLMQKDVGIQAEHMFPGSLPSIPGRAAGRAANTARRPIIPGASWPADSGHDQAISARGTSPAQSLDFNGKPTPVPVAV